MLSDEHRDRMFLQLSGSRIFRQQSFDFGRGEQSRKFFARPQGQRRIARVVRAPMLEDVDDIARLEAVRAIEGHEFTLAIEGGIPASSIVSFCACWFSSGFSRLSRAHGPQKAEPSNTMATITRTVVSVMFISFV